MKVNIFTVADSVNVYEGGKLVIVGTFDNININKCPFVFRPFGVALKFSVEPSDYGKRHNFRLALRKKGTQKALTELPFSVNFSKPPKGKSISATMAATIGGVKFESFGTYVLELKMDSKTISAINLNVVKVKSAENKKTIKTKAAKRR